MNSTGIKSAIRARFCAPEWATFFEVANGTGSAARRYADAVSMNLYPSRGLEVNGFEVKISRSDWTKELKAPDKAEEIAQFCHRWWIVTPPNIIKPGELPAGWGHFIVNEGVMRQAVAAPKLNAVPMTPGFTAALLRRAGEFDNEALLDEVAKRTEQIRKDFESRIEREVQSKTYQFQRLNEQAKLMKEMTGIDLNSYRFESVEVGKAIKMVMESGVLSSYKGLEGLAHSLTKAANDVNKAIADFNQDRQEAA